MKGRQIYPDTVHLRKIIIKFTKGLGGAGVVTNLDKLDAKHAQRDATVVEMASCLDNNLFWIVGLNVEPGQMDEPRMDGVERDLLGTPSVMTMILMGFC